MLYPGLLHNMDTRNEYQILPFLSLSCSIRPVRAGSEARVRSGCPQSFIAGDLYCSREGVSCLQGSDQMHVFHSQLRERVEVRVPLDSEDRE